MTATATASLLSYTFWACLFYVVFLGPLLYAVDKSFGVGIRRFFYSLTHDRQSLPMWQARGFIYRRYLGSRLAVALVVAGIPTLFWAWLGTFNPFAEVMTLIIQIPALVIGFYFGDRFVDRFIGIASDRIQRFEDMEKRVAAGDTTFGREAASVASSAKDRLSETFTPGASSRPSGQGQGPASTTTKPARDLNEDRAGLDRFTGGGTSVKN